MRELVDFFDSLETARLRYAVLRNYERLPFDWGNDIDILIHPKDIAATTELVRRAFRLEVPGARYRQMARWNFISYLIEDFERPLQIDFYTSLTKAWIVYADSDAVLSRTQRTPAGIRIPDPRDELELIAAKELFSYGRLRTKYHATFLVRGKQLSGPEGAIFAGRLTPASIALIQRLLKDPVSRGRLWPTSTTILAPGCLLNWLRKRTNDFVEHGP